MPKRWNDLITWWELRQALGRGTFFKWQHCWRRPIHISRGFPDLSFLHHHQQHHTPHLQAASSQTTSLIHQASYQTTENDYSTPIGRTDARHHSWLRGRKVEIFMGPVCLESEDAMTDRCLTCDRRIKRRTDLLLIGWPTDWNRATATVHYVNRSMVTGRSAPLRRLIAESYQV